MANIGNLSNNQINMTALAPQQMAPAQSERGSVTLESAILFPILFFIICLSIYIILILFEHAQVQTSSGYAAQCVGMAWRGAVLLGGDSGGSVGGAASGSSGFGNAATAPAGLYHRFFDADIGAKAQSASGIAETRLKVLALPGYTQARADARYNNTIFGNTLTVGLNSNTKVPNADVMSLFGRSNVFGARFAAKSLMPDFAESIRTIGYTIEIEKKLEKSTPEFAEVAGSFADMLAHIRGYIGGLIK